MLGADVVMVETPSLIHRQLDHLLGTRGQTNISQHNTVTTPNDKFDRTADFVEFHTEIAEHLGRDPVALADQTQQQMLGADIIMVEALGFFLCEAQHLASPLRKFLESFVAGFLMQVSSSVVIAALTQHLEGLGLHLLQIHTQALQDVHTDTIPFPDQTQQQMLGADITMVKMLCFIGGELDHRSDARSQLDITQYDAVTTLTNR